MGSEMCIRDRFYISDFQGQDGKAATGGTFNASLNNLGGIVKTTFKF